VRILKETISLFFGFYQHGEAQARRREKKYWFGLWTRRDWEDWKSISAVYACASLA